MAFIKHTKSYNMFHVCCNEVLLGGTYIRMFKDLFVISYKIPIFRWFKFTLKPPYSITHGKLRLAIWDTSFWTFWVKFGHKGP